MMFVHKLSALAVFITSFLIILLAFFRYIVPWISNPGKIEISISKTFVPITGIATMIQWMYVSDFFGAVIFKLRRALTTQELATSVEPVDVVTAVRAAPGLEGFLLRRGHGIVLFSLAGFSWILHLFHKSSRVDYLLAGTASMTFLTIFGVISLSSINPVRAYLFIELLLIVLFVSLVMMAFGNDADRNRLKTYSILAFIIITQLITPIAIPESPYGQRQYFTSQEVQAKNFDRFVQDEIATDSPYAAERFRFRSNGAEWIGISSHLLNSDFDIPQRYIMLRTNVRIYRFFDPRGWWVLTYDPSNKLNLSNKKIYSNGGANLYLR
jgi:hypothetical protein